MEVKEIAEEIMEGTNTFETDIANDVNEMSSRGGEAGAAASGRRGAARAAR